MQVDIHSDDPPALRAHFATQAARLGALNDSDEEHVIITVLPDDKFRRSYPRAPGAGAAAATDGGLRESDFCAVESLHVAMAPDVEWPGDLHFAPYYSPTHPGVRLSRAYVAGGVGVIHLTALVVDIDTDGHTEATEEWVASQSKVLDAVAGEEWWGCEPVAAYLTRAGLRVIWPLANEVCISNEAEWDAWGRWYASCLADLRKLGANANYDEKCKDVTRLYRLPGTMRDGVRQPGAVLHPVGEYGMAYHPPDVDAPPTTPTGATPPGTKDRHTELVRLLRTVYVAPDSGQRNSFRMAVCGWLIPWGLSDVAIAAACNDARRAVDHPTGQWKVSPEWVGGQRRRPEEERMGRAWLVAHGRDPVLGNGGGADAVARANGKARDLQQKAAGDFLKKYPEEHETYRRLDTPKADEELVRDRVAAALESFEQRWLRAQLLAGGKGGVRPNVENVTRILTQDSRWEGRLRYNTLGLKAYLDGAPVEDATVDSINRWCSVEYALDFSQDVTHRGVDQAASLDSYNPVLEYLEGCSKRWDGVSRLDSWLQDATGCEVNPYTSAVGRKFLVSMVARAYRPGCKVDTVLALEGKQGLKKSSLLACLVGAGEGWFGDDLPNVKLKDAKEYIPGKWLIEIAEMSAFSHADVVAIKSFITTATDSYRSSYARLNKQCPRSSVFVITTNEAEYLHDATGGRRFWPVTVKRKIDLDALVAVRDQLFAEAVHAYRAGETWWMDAEELEVHQAKEVAERYESDPWEDTIRAWVSREGSCADHFVRAFTMVELLTECLRIDVKDQSSGVQRRAGNVLKVLGLKKWRCTRGPRRTECLWVHELHLAAYQNGAIEDTPKATPVGAIPKFN